MMSRWPACELKTCTLVMALAGLFLACNSAETSQPEPPRDKGPIPYELLSDYEFFSGQLTDLKPADNVIPYSVNAPLWSDGAGKARFIVLPPGEKAVFADMDEWALPNGTIIIKSFFFPLDRREPDGPRRHIETRLLVRDLNAKEGWTAHTYVWNEAQTDAVRIIAGQPMDIHFIDEMGKDVNQFYLVPNTNQCENCHTRNDVYVPLGISTHQLNGMVTINGQQKNQLDYFNERGVFAAAPPSPSALPAFPDPFGNAPLEERARAYLHANCSHCHRPGAEGGPSGLVLLAWESTPAKYGVCKGSVAAGSGTGNHEYDVVPGMPAESIMVFRMSSTDPEVKMPELPNLLPDTRGVDLISQWISAMAPAGCP